MRACAEPWMFEAADIGGGCGIPVHAIGDAPAPDDDFAEAIRFILAPDKDGQGFHITKGDNGGATAWGIIKPTLATYLGRAVTDDDIRALTREKAVPIYRRLFWDAHRCSEMPRGLGFLVFDFACSNIIAARIRLQRLCGVAQDGRIGPITVAATLRLPLPLSLVEYTDSRLAFYRSLSSWELFGRGWERRAREALQLAQQMHARR